MPCRCPKKGQWTFAVSVSAPTVLEGGDWREARFGIPNARRRALQLVGDRSDLEVVFPGGLKQERAIVDDVVHMTAILGPGLPFAVRWKPQVADLAAELVFSTDGSTVATVNPGTLRIDDRIMFDVAQGELDSLQFIVPEGLHIVSVEAAHIRDWRVQTVGEQQQLQVSLNKNVGGSFGVHIEAEQSLPAFPSTLSVPSLKPVGSLRSAGQVAIGTDSAIKLVVDSAAGCSQIDKAAFRSGLKCRPLAWCQPANCLPTPFRRLITKCKSSSTPSCR